ncbi:EF-hand domain-containing protein [Schlesneria paludicola]|uniref:EF-hand domain-containing protein n=1 Tax=Schlesneria paludicola TaxID=360056 RepID=UPI000299CF77|nr:EF-hand domain-containing protein [Schlesneria paludicola]
MIRRMLNLLMLISIAVPLGLSTRSVADETIEHARQPEHVPPSIELLFMTVDLPSRFELQIELDGVPIRDIWETIFARLFEFFDRDANGSLDETEVTRLPSPFAIRQILWGRFALDSGSNPPLHQLDSNANHSVSKEELSAYYRQSGLGDLLIGVGKTSTTEALNDALISSVDLNQDGFADEFEWQSAVDLIERRDSNDDEQIGPGELVTRSAYPGAVGSIFLRPPVPGEAPNPVVAALPFILLPRESLAPKLIVDLLNASNSTNRRIDSHQIVAMLESPPESSCRIQAKTTTEGIQFAYPSTEFSVPPNGPRIAPAGPVRLAMRCDQGKLAAQSVTARKQFEALFAEFDTDSNGTLSPQELSAPRARALGQIAKVADCDHNGSISRTEFSTWLDLMDQIARGHLLLTIIDHGCGLFELIDQNHDGALSRRELRAAADRLRTADCFRDGRLNRNALPHHLLAVVSHGHPQSPLGRPDRQGPAWFQAMDRNGDGDLSRREFTGPTEIFQKFDLNRDGYVDHQEADPDGRK